ncbi:hypothetical protein IFR05_015733 [Cadophora sp. M221]|nr:hypothetical protein IFR05_015733 [Cadophora sp. M221]
MAPASNEEQFKFLISCIRYSNNGKVDFSQVAKECKIVSKGAAAKRYERMMRAHGIASNAAAIKPAPARSLKSERNESVPPSSSSSPPSKKRKADPFLEENTAADDDEGFGSTIKAEPAVTIKEQFVIKEEEPHQHHHQQQRPGQLSLDEAANLIQYYDTPSPYAGIGMDMGMDGSYVGEYTYGPSMSDPNMGRSSISSLYGIASQQPYTFSPSSSYGNRNGNVGGMHSSEVQRIPYQPRLQYSSDEQGGRSDSPVIVD